MNTIRPKARFIPKIPLTTRGFGLLGNGGEGFPLPVLNRHRIALIGPLQRLLRGQSKPGEQLANRRPAKLDADRRTRNGLAPSIASRSAALSSWLAISALTTGMARSVPFPTSANMRPSAEGCLDLDQRLPRDLGLL